MPFPGAQRWLLSRAPTLLSVLIVTLIFASLAWQGLAWQRLLQTPLSASSSASKAASSAEPSALIELFSSPSTGTGNGAPSTNLRLTLLGSFVHAEANRSSAIIALEGSKAKRYLIGSSLSDGVVLHAVYRDRVELKRNGRLETLAFKQPGLTTTASPQPQADANLEQLQQLEQESGNTLRERMQELQQQMQASEPSVDATTEQPKESD